MVTLKIARLLNQFLDQTAILACLLIDSNLRLFYFLSLNFEIISMLYSNIYEKIFFQKQRQMYVFNLKKKYFFANAYFFIFYFVDSVLTNLFSVDCIL